MEKLVIVFALHNDDDKEEHVRRLLETYDLIPIIPRSSSPPPQWISSLNNCMTVQHPYIETTVDEAVCKIHAWEVMNGQVHGVVPLSEGGVELTADIIEKLNETRSGDIPLLQGMPSKTARVVRNKHRFRQVVAPFCKNIKSCVLRNMRDIKHAYSHMTFPAILKPVKGMASTSVRRVDSKHDLLDMFHEVLDSQMPKEWEEEGFVLEEFFEGDEVDVDGWACDGKVEFMVVNDNIPMGPPDFHELGGYYPSRLSHKKQEAIRELTNDVVDALGEMHGVFHFEAKVNDNLEVFAIEMNARVGGKEAPYAMEAITGYYLYEVHAKLATGQTVSRKSIPMYKTIASKNLYLDVECHLLGILHVDSKTIRDENVVVIRYLDNPRHYIPYQASRSCVAWLAVGGYDVIDAMMKLERVEKLIEFKYERFL